MDTKMFKNIRNSLLVIVTFGLPIALLIYFRRDVRALEQMISSAGVAGPLLSILLMGILSATPIPTDPIVILNGAIFGPFIGTLVSWMGNNLAAAIEYFIGHGIGRIADFDKQKKSLPFGLNKFPADSIMFLFFGRFVPQIGGKVVSLTAGVYHVPYWRYLWTAFLSNLFGSVALAVGGYSILHGFL
ncbi:MAG: VTT domain-containing protein [Patescibacteria group bacterium]